MSLQPAQGPLLCHTGPLPAYFLYAPVRFGTAAFAYVEALSPKLPGTFDGPRGFPVCTFGVYGALV